MPSDSHRTGGPPLLPDDGWHWRRALAPHAYRRLVRDLRLLACCPRLGEGSRVPTAAEVEALVASSLDGERIGGYQAVDVIIAAHQALSVKTLDARETTFVLARVPRGICRAIEAALGRQRGATRAGAVLAEWHNDWRADALRAHAVSVGRHLIVRRVATSDRAAIELWDEPFAEIDPTRLRWAARPRGLHARELGTGRTALALYYGGGHLKRRLVVPANPLRVGLPAPFPADLLRPMLAIGNCLAAGAGADASDRAALRRELVALARRYAGSAAAVDLGLTPPRLAAP